MEGLRKQAANGFSRINFLPAPGDHKHELITIASAGSPLERQYLPLSRILKNEPIQNPPPPALRLVKLYMEYTLPSNLTQPPTINASREQVEQLWKWFNLDPMAIHYISKGIRGLHAYQHRLPSSQPPHHGDRSHYQFMATSYAFCIIWTHDLKNQVTSGVAIVRTNYRDRLESCLEALEMQTQAVQHPLCLLMALTMEAVEHASHDSVICQSRIIEIELKTGFNPWNSSLDQQEPPGSMSLDEATTAFRCAGAVLIKLEDHLLHMGSLSHLAESLKQAGFTGSLVGGCSEEVVADIAAGVHEISQQMARWEMRLQYLKERGNNQLHVVNTILNRHDAASSIDIARSAREDSLSMKFITIITMLFLPGTFLATLFAIPSLQWQSDPVVQGNHWIYWAVNIFLTVLVFISWRVLVRREQDQHHNQRKPQALQPWQPWQTWFARENRPPATAEGMTTTTCATGEGLVQRVGAGFGAPLLLLDMENKAVFGRRGGVQTRVSAVAEV